MKPSGAIIRPESKPEPIDQELGTERRREFVRRLSHHTAHDHEKWLLFMRFGMKSLLNDQELLIELIINEAQRQGDFESIEKSLPKILAELQLTITATAD